MSGATHWLQSALRGLDGAGAWLSLLPLRLLPAHAFWTAGVEKYRGENWFGVIQEQFPFPFHRMPVDASWALATWFEPVGAVMLAIGLGTRCFSASPAILTPVAIAAVYAGHGYPISGGGWKLPLMYLVMLLPLMLSGPGRLSLDGWGLVGLWWRK